MSHPVLNVVSQFVFCIDSRQINLDDLMLNLLINVCRLHAVELMIDTLDRSYLINLLTRQMSTEYFISCVLCYFSL